MSVGYIWEKFNGAVGALVGPGSGHERMAAAGAVLGRLEHVSGPFPSPDLADRYAALMRRLTAKPDPKLGSYRATANAMDDATFASVAEEILSLYDAVTRYMPTADE